MDKLLVLLDGGKDNSFIKGTREFLLRFIPVSYKWEPSVTTKTDAYIPWSLGEKKAMVVRAIACDYIQVDNCWVRQY